MKNTKTIKFLLALCSAVLFLNGCHGGGNNGDPNRGFDIQTFAQAQGSGMLFPTAGNVRGDFLNGSGTYGTVTSFNQNFGGVGLLPISGAKVPGTWRLTLAPNAVPGSLCLTSRTTDQDVNRGSKVDLVCPGRFFMFPMLLDTIDSTNIPATLTFNGQGIDATYGTPMTVFYNEFGAIVASVPASQYLTDSNGISGLSVDTPGNFSAMPDGLYPVVIYNIASDGSPDVIGASQLTIYGNPPPPPPGDGGLDCNNQPRDRDQLPCDEQQQ